MNHRSLSLSPLLALLAVAGLTLGLAGPVAAEKADRDQPMNAEADQLRYDDLQQTSVFTGNVVITKGTIIVRGAQVDVRQDPEGYQYAVAVGQPGKLAYYRKKRDGVDEYIEGEGERIEYDSRADNVKFIKRAVVRRISGQAKLLDETTGGLIVYDNTTDVFNVQAGAEGATPGNPGGRVRTMMSPRNAPAAAAPAAPTVPSGTPAAPLRPSTTLGAEKK